MSLRRALVVVVLVIVVLLSAVLVIVSTYDYNKLKPQIESAFKEATGRELTLKGKLDLEVGLNPTLVVTDAALQNAPWGSRPEMAEIKRFEVQLSLIPLIFRHLDVRRLVLVNPDILVETSPSGESNLGFLTKMSTGKANKESPTANKVRLTVNEIDVKNGHLTYRNGKTNAAYVVMLKRFDASAPSADRPLKLSLDGSYNGKSFSVSGNVVPLASLSDTSRPWPFNLTMSIAGATASLEGTIRDLTGLRGLNILVKAKSNDAGQMGELLGEPIPVQGPVEMSCRITDPRPKVYEIAELNVKAAGSDVNGSLSADLSKPRPLLTADLRSKRIDLRSFVGKKEGPSKKQETGNRVFPNSPLPLESLPSIDATVSLNAAEVLTPQLALRDLDAGLALTDGRLSIKPLTAVVGGGNLNGRIDVESQGKAAQMATIVTIKQLDVGALERELKKPNILEGRADVSVNVSGRGESVAGLMAGLNGMVYVIMGEGRINNRYMGILGSNITSNVFRMINPFNKESPSTQVSCIVCGFKITNGIAETTALVVNSDYMSVVGDGTLNLQTEGLDFSLKPVPKEGIGTGITGKLNVSLGELTRPFKLGGTLAHPSLGIDYEQTAIAAGKAVGGLMLLGPVGLGSVLVGSSSDEKRLCPLAIKAAQQGVKLSAVEKGQERGIVGKATQGIEKGVGGIEKGLKSIFGK